MIQKLERRFGHLGIPGLLRLVGIMQIIVYVTLLLKVDVIDLLFLDGDKVMGGEVWRIFTFSFIPYTKSIIWFIFSIMILFFVGDGLEAAWGAFRVTVFYVCTVVLIGLGVWFGPTYYIVVSYYISLIVFMAFAMIYPTQVINVFGILPVQAQWLGWLDAAIVAWDFYSEPPYRLALGLGLIPLLIFAVPALVRNFRQRSRVAARRAKFEENSLPESEFFSKCQVCGRTDVTNPELTFRVASDDQEYCMEHMPTNTNLTKRE